MDNDICSFKVIETPNRRYANTVNLVFFRAIPLTKNFKKYVDGLKNWKILMKKYYPESQLQIFIDESIASDPQIQDVLVNMDARIYLFECPEYLRDDGFHIGLFATMVRFYPFFDVNTHPMKIAHIQELEPNEDTYHTFESTNKATLMKYQHRPSLIYYSNDIYEMIKEFKDQPTFENGVRFPWILAGRFTAMEKIPFKLWKDYLKDIESGKKMFNKYLYIKGQEGNTSIKEHGNFSFGVDETFLNEVFLRWLIKHHHAVGFIVNYKPSYPLFYLRKKLLSDKRTKEIIEYILQKKQKSSQEALTYTDNLFYYHSNTQKAKSCLDRFYKVIEEYPNWLGLSQTYITLRLFKGYMERTCIVIVKDDSIVEIKDL